MNMHVSTYTKMYKEGYTDFDTRGLYVSYNDVHDYVTDFFSLLWKNNIAVELVMMIWWLGCKTGLLYEMKWKYLVLIHDATLSFMPFDNLQVSFS